MIKKLRKNINKKLYSIEIYRAWRRKQGIKRKVNGLTTHLRTPHKLGDLYFPESKPDNGLLQVVVWAYNGAWRTRPFIPGKDSEFQIIRYWTYFFGSRLYITKWNALKRLFKYL